MMPWLVGRLQDRGTPISAAIGSAMLASGAIALVFIWLGPETRGRVFFAEAS
jgi:hypothetical protein